MLDVLSEAPTANGWLANKKGALKGEPADTTLDLKTMRKDIMSMVATGAVNGTGHAAVVGHAGGVLGRGGERLGRQGHRRAAEVLPRAHGTEFQIGPLATGCRSPALP